MEREGGEDGSLVGLHSIFVEPSRIAVQVGGNRGRMRLQSDEITEMRSVMDAGIAIASDGKERLNPSNPPWSLEGEGEGSRWVRDRPSDLKRS